jgi:nucleoside-diphosphate-sugar epimerase
MDVRDAVKAYWIMMEKSKPGEVYNIGGSKTLTIEEILNKLIEYSSKEIKYKVDKELLRPSDVTLQIPDTNKFFNLTKWQPKINWETTLLDLLNYHRNKINKLTNDNI